MFVYHLILLFCGAVFHFTEKLYTEVWCFMVKKKKIFQLFQIKKTKMQQQHFSKKAPLLQKVDDLMGEKKFQFFFL